MLLFHSGYKCQRDIAAALRMLCSRGSDLATEAERNKKALPRRNRYVSRGSRRIARFTREHKMPILFPLEGLWIVAGSGPMIEIFVRSSYDPPMLRGKDSDVHCGRVTYLERSTVYFITPCANFLRLRGIFANLAQL